MTLEQLEILTRIACFMLGVSVASLINEFGIAKSLRRIAKAQEKFANDFSEVKK